MQGDAWVGFHGHSISPKIFTPSLMSDIAGKKLIYLIRQLFYCQRSWLTDSKFDRGKNFPPKTQLFVREHLSLRISRTGLSKYRQHNKTFLHLHFPRQKATPTTVEETPIDSEDFVQRCRMSINIHQKLIKNFTRGQLTTH